MVEIPAMTILAILGSVVGVLAPGSSFSLSAVRLDMLICPEPQNFCSICLNCAEISAPLAMVASLSAQTSSILALVVWERPRVLGVRA